ILVKACIEENAVSANRPSQSAAELLLAIVRLAGGKCLLGVKVAVAKVIERSTVPVIATRLGHYVEHSTASPAQFGAIGVRRDAKLLDDFVAELIGRAITSPRLCIKRIVVVGAVHQEIVLESTDTAERQVAIRIGGKTARILRHSRGKQRQIGEAAAI